jgi:7-cyano-7-deazaguanine synthase
MTSETKPEKAIALLSGGLDSTVALAVILNRMPVACALTFNYGQRAAQQEIAATQKITQHYGLPHRIIELPWLSELLPQGLTPGLENEQPATMDTETLFDIHRVWVPNRNGLFLNIGACYAEALGCSHVVFGANAEEGQEFPDNTPEFRNALNQVLQYSTLNGVQVETPVGALNKTEIIQRGIALGVPFELIWSCYENRDVQCGECPSCLRVKAARNQINQLTGQRVTLAFSAE